MSIDGVGYLDMADAFRGGVWKDTVNGVWSPLYPAVLAVGLSMREYLAISEFQAVYAINFAIFGAVLAGFEFLLRQAFAALAEIHGSWHTEPLPSWIWFATARILFVWTTATMLPANLVTPDLLASGVMYAAIGLLLRMARGPATAGTAVLFGASLGVGYLAKAVLFPLGILFLGMLWAARRRSQDRWRQLGISAAVFALTAGPYVTALSLDKGRFTFSDVGRLNYAWHVNGLPSLHWQGGPQGQGTPLHPTRRIFDDPAIYEFDGPVGGTVPVWYDPSYWYEGVRLRFDAYDQIAMIVKGLKSYWRIFGISLGGFIVLPAISLVLGHGWKPTLRLLGSQWILLTPAAAALGIYALLHVEGRYIGAFAILFGMAALNAVAMPSGGKPRRLLLILAAAWLAGLSAKAVYSGFRSPPLIVGRLTRLAFDVAGELHKQGVRRGDRVATLTASAARWDRMLGVKVAAHAEWWREGVEDKYWALSPAQREEIYRRLGDLKLTGIVLEAANKPVGEPGWRQLGSTNHYWKPLPEIEQPSARASRVE